MSHRRESGAVPPWVVLETPQKITLVDHTKHTIDTKPNQEVKSQENTSMGDARHSTADITSRISHNKSENRYICILNGEVVNNDCIQKTNILIENGKIILMGNKLEAPNGVPILDASGLLVMPGGVDLVGLNPGVNNADTLLELTKEALIGGTTTIVQTIVCTDGALPMNELTKFRNQTREMKLWCNVACRVGLTEVNDAVLDQFDALVKQHHINSFLFISSKLDPYSGREVRTLEQSQLKLAFQKCRQLGAVAMVGFGTAEPTVSLQREVLENAIQAAEHSNCPLVLVLPRNAGILKEIEQARQHVPPIHLYVNCSPGNIISTNHEFLNSLACGEINTVSSDASLLQTKSEPYMAGSMGQRIIATWEATIPSGWVDACNFASITSANAARYSGLYPHKGRVSPGSDADLILWPIKSLAQSRCEGPTTVIIQGKLMCRDGHLITDANEFRSFLIPNGDVTVSQIKAVVPEGELICTEAYPPAIYSSVTATDRLRKSYQSMQVKDPPEMKSLNDDGMIGSGDTRNNSNNQNLQETEPDVGTNLTKNTNDAQESVNARMIHGHRDLHASGFSLSGAQVDDKQPHRFGIRTSQPPGGQSRNPLW